MKDPYSTIISALRTEKGTMQLAMNKYIFAVNKKANKIDIKMAIEEIYKVKVKSVNTVTARGKKRKVRFVEGKTPDWKKAIVTLREGQKIDIA